MGSAPQFDFLRQELPELAGEVFDYIKAVLTAGEDDFLTPDDVFDAVGHVIMGAYDTRRGELDIQHVCYKLFLELRYNDIDRNASNPHPFDEQRVLEAPVNLREMANDRDSNVASLEALSLTPFASQTKVDQKKLERAEARLKEKAEKRTDKPKSNGFVPDESATVSQSVSRKDMRQSVKGNFNCKDIHIENLDVSFAEKALIRGANLNLVYGHRYGFVGRNGLGKTTLLRMLSGGHLAIPPHISILHVEQEVVGDDTPAVESVLQCDTRREELLAEQKQLLDLLNSRTSEEPDQGAVTRLEQVYCELNATEAEKAPARAARILMGLGFPPEKQSLPTKVFSGGWRMRLALARALFSLPDLLLLDEPTNMLDMKAIIWLENYLQTWPSTLLVVSHDRSFLNSVATDIILLYRQELEPYKGNYDNFIKARNERLKNLQRDFEAQQQFRSHVQEFIDKFRYNAKRASLVQSKIKMLEKLPVLVPVEKETEVSFHFAVPEKLNGSVLQLDQVTFGYTPDRSVLKNVNLSANMDSRICIAGENGTGKSTLLKLLIEVHEPNKGLRHVNRNLRIGYFSQHHVDQLDMDVVVLEFLMNQFPGRTHEEYRHRLGAFGIAANLALQRVCTLSGGQKSRLAFSVMAMTSPNFLILDEPTNHLDVETVEALGKALNEFQGGVILVSHDEQLIRMVCKELWICGNQDVVRMEGGFDEYRALVEQQLEMA